MSVGEPILVLIVFWAAVHLVHRLYLRKSLSSVLPLTNRRAAPFRHTNLTLHAFHLKISTSRWNTTHDKLTTVLSSPSGGVFRVRGDPMRRPRLGAFVEKLYDFGILAGAIGMLVVSVGLVILAALGAIGALQTFTSWLEEVAGPSREDPSSMLERRTIGDAVVEFPRGDTTTGPSITPIIPGITVPLSHFPIILVAVFGAQIIHEAGHAIAAARESIPLLSSGVSFTLFLPAFFVSFSSTLTSTIPARARARIIAAGPFHNLVFWLIMYLCSRSGFNNFTSHLAGAIIGYHDISDVGKVVVSVDQASPLLLHIRPGSVITALDDTPLSSLASSSLNIDTWTQYLTSPTEPLAKGWCVSLATFDKSDKCCAASPRSRKSHGQPQHPLTCFNAFKSPLASTSANIGTFHGPSRACIDPVPVLTRVSHSTDDQGDAPKRCLSTAECPEASLCLQPKPSSGLMRITVRPPDGNAGNEGVVLWSGPKSEVLEEVLVSKWRPKWWFLSARIPLIVESLCEYLTMATLSLYLFNLLPLRYLDGTELLQSFIEIYQDKGLSGKLAAYEYDVESLEGGSGPGGSPEEGTRANKRWKEKVVETTQTVLSSALGLYVVAGVVTYIFS